MIIGLVLCGSVATLLLFGVAERIFKSFGIAVWLAFVIVAGLIAVAFVPVFKVGAIELNIAGFFGPLVFAALFFGVAARTRECLRAFVSATVVLALALSVWLLIAPVSNGTVTAIAVGFLCGATAFLVGRTRIAALSSLFLGLPVAETVASAVELFIYGTPIRFGSAATYDAVILASVFSIAIFEAVSAIKRISSAKRVLSEASEEFVDPEEYKKYFDE